MGRAILFHLIGHADIAIDHERAMKEWEDA